MKYSTKDKEFIGETHDMTNNKCYGFSKDGYIHIVYNIGEETERVTKEKIDIIKNNLDDYAWTPFAIFAQQIS